MRLCGNTFACCSFLASKTRFACAEQIETMYHNHLGWTHSYWQINFATAHDHRLVYCIVQDTKLRCVTAICRTMGVLCGLQNVLQIQIAIQKKKKNDQNVLPFANENQKVSLEVTRTFTSRQLSRLSRMLPRYICRACWFTHFIPTRLQSFSHFTFDARMRLIQFNYMINFVVCCNTAVVLQSNRKSQTHYG